MGQYSGCRPQSKMNQRRFPGATKPARNLPVYVQVMPSTRNCSSVLPVNTTDLMRELQAREVCVEMAVTSKSPERAPSTSAANVPVDRIQSFCASSSAEPVLPVHLFALPEGYARVVAWLKQPRDSTTPRVPTTEIVLAVRSRPPL